MDVSTDDRDVIRQLSTDSLRGWLNGQWPESQVYQAARNELARREAQTGWIKWGVFSGLAALTLFLSLYSMFVRE